MKWVRDTWKPTDAPLLRWILSDEDTAGRRQCCAFSSTLEERGLSFVQALDRTKQAQTGVDKVAQARLGEHVIRVEAVSLPMLEIKPNAIETCPPPAIRNRARISGQTDRRPAGRAGQSAADIEEKCEILCINAGS